MFKQGNKDKNEDTAPKQLVTFLRIDGNTTHTVNICLVSCPVSLSTQTCRPLVHTFVALVGSSSHRSMRMLLFSGPLPLSMNQPPVETSVPALGGGLAVLAGLLAAC